MKHVLPKAAALAASIALAGAALAADKSPNGIALPDGYKNWRLIAPSQRSDNNTIRVILGNDVAVEAARAGRTSPWPDGAVLAKLAWKNRTHEKWSSAIVPGDFIQAEFMVKDSKQYAQTGGWGFARWIGKDQKPYGKDAAFAQECFGCHAPMKDKDWVFTEVAPLP